jgi:hypothetical protein
MKKCLVFGALIAFGAPLIGSAQCLPGQLPNSVLNGKTYAFRVSGPQTAAIGKFTAFAGGYLAITETVTDVSGAIPYQVVRTAPTSGRWMVGADCTSGMLLFNMNRASFQLNFTTAVGNSSLLTISGQNTSNPSAQAGPTTPTDPARLAGIAQELAGPVTACAAGALNSLNGVTFGYNLAGGAVPGNRAAGTFSETGSFRGFLTNPLAYSGNLTVGVNLNLGVPPVVTPTPRTILAISPAAGGVPVQQPSGGATTLYSALGASGRYTVYNDCSGGEVMFMAQGFAIQVEFVFSRTDGSEMFMLADDLSSSSLRHPYSGVGTRN